MCLNSIILANSMIFIPKSRAVPLHPMMSHETGGGSESGALLGNL